MGSTCSSVVVVQLLASSLAGTVSWSAGTCHSFFFLGVLGLVTAFFFLGVLGLVTAFFFDRERVKRKLAITQSFEAIHLFAPTLHDGS